MVEDISMKVSDKNIKKMAKKLKRKAITKGETNTTIGKFHKGCKAEIEDLPEKTKVDQSPDGTNKKAITDNTEKYPVLNDENFKQKIHSVPLTNNQKGRIRQSLKDNLMGTSESLLPDIIHNKIQVILKSSENYTDADLRKMRILFNMLKTAVQNKVPTPEKISVKESKKVLKNKEKVKEDSVINVIKEDINLEEESKQKEKKDVPKKKGPKRYVVFVGNLPMETDKEKIMEHFSDIKKFIKDVRLPKQKEGKSPIAYVELENETTYELALSKHHSMLGNKRINILYTTQKNGKITKTEAKSKTAKLLALQKSGKLIGSVPLNRKRSQRRLKKKRAEAKLAAESA